MRQELEHPVITKMLEQGEIEPEDLEDLEEYDYDRAYEERRDERFENW